MKILEEAVLMSYWLNSISNNNNNCKCMQNKYSINNNFNNRIAKQGFESNQRERIRIERNIF